MTISIICVRCDHHYDDVCGASVCGATVCGSQGLSAQRALRTKSSRPEGSKGCPKGRRLKVGAQRAPKLLLIHNLANIGTVTGVSNIFLIF